MIRILVAGLLGGIALFIGGAFGHMVLQMEDRALKPLSDEGAARDFVKAQSLEPGIYEFPAHAANIDKMTSAEQTIENNRVNELYRAGPAGFVIIAPRGENIMGAKQLGGEFIGDLIAATLAAFIVAHMSKFATFARRWLIVVLLAPISWLTLTLSWVLWFRFPLAFVQDGLFAALIEWTLAGAVIAAIVRPIMHSR